MSLTLTVRNHDLLVFRNLLAVEEKLFPVLLGAYVREGFTKHSRILLGIPDCA